MNVIENFSDKAVYTLFSSWPSLLHPLLPGFSCSSSPLSGHQSPAEQLINDRGHLLCTLHVPEKVLHALQTSLICTIMAGLIYICDYVHIYYICVSVCIYPVGMYGLTCLFLYTQMCGQALSGFSSPSWEPGSCLHCLWGTDSYVSNI